MGFAAFCYAVNKEAMREYHFHRTVISSASEKSFSFAEKRCMRVNGNGKPVYACIGEYGVSSKWISAGIKKAAGTKIPRLRSG